MPNKLLLGTGLALTVTIAATPAFATELKPAPKTATPIVLSESAKTATIPTATGPKRAAQMMPLAGAETDLPRGDYHQIIHRTQSPHIAATIPEDGTMTLNMSTVRPLTVDESNAFRTELSNNPHLAHRWQTLLATTQATTGGTWALVKAKVIPADGSSGQDHNGVFIPTSHVAVVSFVPGSPPGGFGLGPSRVQTDKCGTVAIWDAKTGANLDSYGFCPIKPGHR